MKVSEALKILTDRFRSQKIPTVLIGGMALYAYGGARVTTDVDFLLSDDHVKNVMMVLEKEGYKVKQKHDLFVRFEKPGLTLAAIDFVFVDEETFSTIQKEGRIMTMAGMEFVVPSIQHLIALKLHAIKNNPSRKDKDLADVVGLIRKNGISIRSKDMAHLFEKYGTPGIYQLACLMIEG